MTSEVRAAIVGLGRWGRALVASVQGKSDAIRFVAAHTRTRAPAEDFCQAYGLRLVDSYEQLLSEPTIDAVVLATPHSLHRQQITVAAAAGKHIHVEKPITLDRASADAAVAAVRKAGVVLADHVKCLDWQARKAEFVCTVDEGTVEEVVQRLLALVDPSEGED